MHMTFDESNNSLSIEKEININDVIEEIKHKNNHANVEIHNDNQQFQDIQANPSHDHIEKVYSQQTSPKEYKFLKDHPQILGEPSNGVVTHFSTQNTFEHATFYFTTRT